MKKVCLYFIIMITSAAFPLTDESPPQQNQTPSITELMQACYNLDCLWHALYGAHNPLKPYIHTFQKAIGTLAQEKQKMKRLHRERNIIEDTVQEGINALAEKLSTLHEQVTTLINNYQLQPTSPLPESASPLALTPPSNYTATPLPTSTPAATDIAMQQIFQSLNQLQQSQLSPQHGPEPSSLKEQLILFSFGILFLTCATYALKKHLTPNIQNLKNHLKPLNNACAPTHKKGDVGMIGVLDCTKNKLDGMSTAS